MIPVLAVVALMLLGVFLLAIELFLLPGILLVGALGVVSVLGSIWTAYAYGGTGDAGITILGGIVAAGSCFRVFRKTRRGALSRDEGGEGHEVPADESLTALIGREGVTVTAVRPTGSVEVDGRVLDAICESGYLPRGVAIRVVAVHGAQIGVESVS